jgi:gamma-glutamyl phosphate reductase
MAEAKVFEQHAKTLELKNDALDTLVEAQKKQISNILANEAEAIANNHFDHKEPETIERLKLSISTISDLIEKGAKIIPSSSDSDTTKLFPDYNSLSLIESSIKQLMSNDK